MKSIILPLLGSFVFSTTLFCCKKSSQSTCRYDAIPSSLILKFTKNGCVVADAVLNNIKLRYWQGNQKKYVADFDISTDTSNQNKGLIASRNIGILSADNNIKTYYIEYSDGWTTDTLFVDYLSPAPATNCLYTQQSVKYNGQVTATDNTFQFDSPVYSVNKN